MPAYTFQRPRKRRQPPNAVNIYTEIPEHFVDEGSASPVNYGKGMFYVSILILMVISVTAFFILTKGIALKA